VIRRLADGHEAHVAQVAARIAVGEQDDAGIGVMRAQVRAGRDDRRQDLARRDVEPRVAERRRELLPRVRGRVRQQPERDARLAEVGERADRTGDRRPGGDQNPVDVEQDRVDVHRVSVAPLTDGRPG
jgi:hypothetical protein